MRIQPSKNIYFGTKKNKIKQKQIPHPLYSTLLWQLKLTNPQFPLLILTKNSEYINKHRETVKSAEKTEGMTWGPCVFHLSPIFQTGYLRSTNRHRPKEKKKSPEKSLLYLAQWQEGQQGDRKLLDNILVSAKHQRRISCSITNLISNSQVRTLDVQRNCVYQENSIRKSKNDYIIIRSNRH